MVKVVLIPGPDHPITISPTQERVVVRVGEQVIGRALRRQSYELNDENKFNVEYADVLGIPFDFNAKPVEGLREQCRRSDAANAGAERVQL